MLRFAAVPCSLSCCTWATPPPGLRYRPCLRPNPTFAGFADRIDLERRGVGIVVGLVTPEGRKVIAHGGVDHGDPRKVRGDTVFEVGSVGKVFTALLLADMARREEVALADPVARYLPPRVHVPERGGRAITLQDLATHHSGLPRLPTNFVPRDLPTLMRTIRSTGSTNSSPVFS